jgi:exonuclease V gamma subunit
MLIVSHQTEFLLDMLADRLAHGNGPLREQWIVIASLRQKQWLMLRLAERMPNRAIAGVRILGWREALRRLVDTRIPDHIELTLRLASILKNVKNDPVLEFLTDSLKSDKLAALAQSLSNQILKALFYERSSQTPWQARICELLSAESFWLADRLPHSRWPESVCEVHCIGTEEMPPVGWDFFIRHAPKLFIYLFSPCRMFWEDILSDAQRCWMRERLLQKQVSSESIDTLDAYLLDTHPLLANWGRLGRETLRRLQRYGLEREDFYNEPPPSPRSTLEALQQDLLWLRTRCDAPTFLRDSQDGSVRVVSAGITRLDEVRLLKNNIEQFLQSQSASCSGILVLAPDISIYEPLIRFVFNAQLPVRIAPVSCFSTNPLLQGLQLFFELSNRNWEPDHVMELFENSAFRAAQQLTTEDLSQFHLWVREGRVRAGFSGSPGSWTEGLRRMVAGLVFLVPDNEPFDGVRSIDWGQAQKLNQWIGLIERIESYLSKWRCQSYRLSEWVAMLRNMQQEFFEKDSKDSDLWENFLRHLISTPPEMAENEFDFSLIRSLFEQHCQSAVGAFQPLLIDAIECLSLQTGSIRPARALFFLGMDSEHFSMADACSSLEWKHAQIPESDSMRYLLLEALFAARDQIIISYCPVSQYDGKLIEPSHWVQELMQLIDDFYPLEKTFPPVSSASVSARVLNESETFWTMPPLLSPQPVLKIDLASLQTLMRHPWKYFLQERLGIYLKQEPLFSVLREKDLSLPPWVESQVIHTILLSSFEEAKRRYEYLFAPGSFGDLAVLQLKKKSAEWKTHLEKWGVKPRDISRIRFGGRQNRNSPLDDAGPAAITNEYPAIRVDLAGQNREIVGEVSLASRQGVFILTDLDLKGCLRCWPSFLACKTVFADASIYSLKKGEKKEWKELNAASALCRLVQYAIHAKERISPLIDPWLEPFLQGDFEKWKKQVQKTALESDDVTIRWVLARSGLPPERRIWEEWSEVLKETLSDIQWEAVKDAAL